MADSDNGVSGGDDETSSGADRLLAGRLLADRLLAGRLLTVREFGRSWRATGSIAPSGTRLARALSRHVRPGPRGPLKVLEVGPGTGAVTRHIVRRLGPAGTLQLVESSPRFATRLRTLLTHDPEFRPVADRVRLRVGRIEEFALPHRYDAIVCGLPFANFPPETVAAILDRLTAALAPDGHLSFFGYAALPRLATLTVGRRERARLTAIRAALTDRLSHPSTTRELVLANLPPAWVHHLAAPPTRRTRTDAVPASSLRL